MLLRTILFFFISFHLYAQTTLKEVYSIKNNEVHLSDLFPQIQKDQILFTVDNYKHSKRIKSKDLLAILKKLGIKEVKTSSYYVNFQISSPIDTTPLHKFLDNYYKEKYPTIIFNNIQVHSRGYIDKLPNNYSIEIRENSYLRSKNIINIKSDTGKKLFFNYSIHASIKVLITKKTIQRHGELSLLNTKFKTIKFDNFRALPIMEFHKKSYQVARTMKMDKILTIRDIQKLDLVRRNSMVSVELDNNGIFITFQAKALQSGTLGDIITIQKTNLKRLQARVIGRKRVQIQ